MWLQKYKTRMRWQELQVKSRAKQQMQREAWESYTDRDTHVIKKGAGRRPAPQNTRQEWDDKSFRSNHRRSNRCKEKLKTSTQTEPHMRFKKKLVVGQASRRQLPCKPSVFNFPIIQFVNSSRFNISTSPFQCSKFHLFKCPCTTRDLQLPISFCQNRRV